MICEPFHLLDCSLPSDGGGIVLVARADLARKWTRQPAYVAGFVDSTQASFPNGTGLAGTAAPGFDQTFNGNVDAFAVKLDAAKVGDDGVYDQLAGEGADDWFWICLNDTYDRNSVTPGREHNRDRGRS